MAQSAFHTTLISGSFKDRLAASIGDSLAPAFEAPTPKPQQDRLAQLVAAIHRQLPLDRLAVFARVYETDDVVSRLPFVGRARLTVSVRDPIDEVQRVISSTRIVLGSLATDHVGYCSFDLRPTRDLGSLLALAQAIPPDVDPPQVAVALGLELLPFGDELFFIDAMAVGDVAFRVVLVRHHVERDWLLGRAADRPLPSIQNPDIEDWRLSPGSFALSPRQLVGESGCEDLYPSDVASSQFQFHQAVRRIDTAKQLDSKLVRAVRYGYLLEYRSQWFPIGHSLGRILYSLPLAPGEKVNLAIVDWSRTDTASRAEATSLVETLNHDQQRDRTVSEVVAAAVRERQSGHSSMGGLGLSALVPAGGALLGGSLSYGATSSASGGTRHVSADTTQQLSDGFHQASAALRQLRSTVITQASQVEAGRFETRTITNFNHCHTLTVVYYEVLRHYRVVSSLVNRRPVVFLDFSTAVQINLDDEASVVAHRASLEAALLDPRHLSGFDALHRVRAARAKLADAQAKFNESVAVPSAEEFEFSRVYVLISTGDNGTAGKVFLTFVLKDGRSVRCRQLEPTPGGDEFSLDTEDVNDFRANSMDAFVVEPESQFRWRDLRGVILRHARTDQQIALNQPDKWQLAGVELLGVTPDGRAAVLLKKQLDDTLQDSSLPEVEVRAPDTTGPAATSPQLTDFIDGDDVERARALMEHLGAFRAHYSVAALVGGDSILRAENLKNIQVVDGASLFDVIDNRVVANAGAELAFPLSEVGDFLMRREFAMKEEDEPAFDAVTAEDLISLPTRGVFADGKLGHCSTCEVIDNTRFWDFQKSPIPGEAPAIAPLDTSSRFQRPEGLSPTAFPASVVNIATPPAAPDPVALGAALQLLGSGSVFRDMSGAAGLASFLSSVVQGTTSAVTAFAGDKRQSDLIEQIQNIPDLTPEQKTSLIGQLLGGPAAGAPSTAAGTNGATTSSEPAPDTPTTGDGPSSVEAPVRPTPGPRPSKPTRPRPSPPSARSILVSVNLEGLIDPDLVSASLDVQPVGNDIPIRTERVGVTTGFVQLAIPETASSAGQMQVSLFIEVRKQHVPGTGETLKDILGITVAKGGEVRLVAQDTYDFGATKQVVRFEARPEVEFTTVKATTFDEAIKKGGAKIGAGFKVVEAVLTLFADAEIESGVTDTESETVERQFTVKAVSEKLILERKDL